MKSKTRFLVYLMLVFVFLACVVSEAVMIYLGSEKLILVPAAPSWFRMMSRV
jgi:hypothetical protein